MGNLENVRIVCVDFEASAETRENVLIIFKNLLDEVPYDAFLEVRLSKIATGFEGRIDVSSIAGEFTSVQTAMTPQDLAGQLAKDLRIQLNQWKSKRFLSAPTEVIA